MTQDHEPYQPTLGVTDDLAGTLEALPLTFGELPTSAMDDLDVTVVGLSVRVATHEVSTTRDGREIVDDRDQLVMDLRVNNWEEAGLQDQYVGQRFNLRPAITKADGSVTRGKPVQSSGWGGWLAALEQFGISGEPKMAEHYQLTAQTDLIGLHFQRKGEQRKIEGRDGAADSTYTSYLPAEIYGWDNDVRTETGLAPIVPDPENEGRFVKGEGASRSRR